MLQFLPIFAPVIFSLKAFHFTYKLFNINFLPPPASNLALTDYFSCHLTIFFFV